ncbi:hypothetical protein SNR37_001130 [Agarivorans aestuarii]|uniref:Lipocalin-like domain-containing protein n=1 Tax=Agarivorans aestuarii TaxID=1563703 RepID=A0ABU7G925_9ALTE|nr:hypothetical protein [Agarivorans aestuarii]MEE1675803.1 hypothetical protein [Agarivorans aestuarii]
MNISKFGAVVVLAACSNGVATEDLKLTKEQFQGAWQCSSVLSVSKLDSVTIYGPDGSFTGFANSITISDVDASSVEFDLYVSGSWILEGHSLLTDIGYFDVLPKSAASNKHLANVKKVLDDPAMKHSKQEIVFLNSTTMEMRNNKGTVQTCYKAASAEKI